MDRKPKPDFDRYLTALRCDKPDRVPLGDCYIDAALKSAFLGRRVIALDDEVEFWYKAGFDFVPCFAGLGEWMGGPEIRKATGESYGKKPKRRADRYKGCITDWEQFEQHDWPSVDDFNFSKWDYLNRIMPSGMKAVAVLGRIFTSVWMSMGAEVFFRSMDEKEDLMAALYEKVGTIQYETLMRLVKYPCLGAVINNDDLAYATGLMVHPVYLRKYLFPWYKKMGDICHERALGYIFHSDGNHMEIMEDLIECGYQAIHPIEPDAMDIEQVKRRWGRKLCLIGNIDLHTTLVEGTPEDVRAESYERIRILAPEGGYMLGSSSSITDSVPLDNMKALFDAAFEYGQYPISLEYRSFRRQDSRGEPATEKSENTGMATPDPDAVIFCDHH